MGWGLGLPHGDFGDFEIPFSIFFYLLSGKYYILGISAL